jgi:hypothetical protein
MKADEQVGDTTLKGVMSMTGYGQADLQRLNFVFATRANGGVSVSEFGEMLEQAAKDAGIRFSGKTQEEGANALLSLLGEVETMGDINRYVERNRMREAKKLYDEEANHFEDMHEMVVWDEYGMSYADYRKPQDAITCIVEIRAGFTQDFWESDTYKDFISNFADLPYLGWLNWFFPVGDCLVVMSAWLGAVGLFYLYSIVMRWLKMIGD